MHELYPFEPGRRKAMKDLQRHLEKLSEEFDHFKGEYFAKDDSWSGTSRSVVVRIDGPLSESGLQISQASQRKNPLGEIVEILTIPVGLLANPNPAAPAQHSVHFRHNPLGFGQVVLVSKLLVKRNEEDDSKSIRPEVAQSVGPNLLLSHPFQPGEHEGYVLEHLRSSEPVGS